MTVADVFAIKNRGLVATGQIESGTVRVGDALLIDGERQTSVSGVEMFRKVVDAASAPDSVGLLLDGVDKDDVQAGSVLTSESGGGAVYDRRAELERMRDAGLMTDEQVEEALRS